MSRSPFQRLASGLNEDFSRSETLSSISAALQQQTRSNRMYARKQIHSYEKLVRLFQERSRGRRRTQEIVEQLRRHNTWLRERLDRMREERTKKRTELEAQRALILQHLEDQADAWLRKRSETEQRFKVELQSYAKMYQEELCTIFDVISRLKTKLHGIEKSQAESLRNTSKSYAAAIDCIERNNAFELKKRQHEVHNTHRECRTRKARMEQRFLDTLHRLRNIRGDPNREKCLERAGKRYSDDQDYFVIEDSDEDEEWI